MIMWVVSSPTETGWASTHFSTFFNERVRNILPFDLEDPYLSVHAYREV